MSWQLGGVGILMSLVIASAIAVVYSKHQSRKLFVELQGLKTQRDELEIEWGRLQLEQSTWATHGRIERLARERLRMRLPPAQSSVLVRP
jgi:cell division protein FtsL